MTRYQYNQQLDPPAPFVHVVLARPDKALALPESPAQIDTAADITVLPASLVERLGLLQLDSINVQGFGGMSVSVPTYLVRLAIRGKPEIIVEVIASMGETHVLLGRDVLNKFDLHLNGPNGILEIA